MTKLSDSGLEEAREIDRRSTEHGRSSVITFLFCGLGSVRRNLGNGGLLEGELMFYRVLIFLAAVVLGLVGSDTGFADERGAEGLRASFAKHQLLVHTGTVMGEKCTCLIDTGVGGAVVDVAFSQDVKRTHKAKPVNMVTLSGSRAAEMYEDVPISLESFPLVKLPTAVIDLESFRETTGTMANVIVGGTYFTKHAIRFRSHFPEIVPIEELSADTGRWEKMSEHLGAPTIPISFPVLGEESAVLDTGLRAALVVETSVAEALERSGNAVELAVGKLLDAGGITDRREFIVREVTVLGTTFRNVLATTGRHNFVGTSILKEIDFTIDLQRQRYRIDRPSEAQLVQLPLNASGLSVVWDNELRWKIIRVKTGSVAALSGLRVGDELVSINMEPTAEMTFWGIQQRLAKGGETIRVELQRDGKVLTVDLALQHHFEYPPKWKPRAADADDFFESLKKDGPKK